MRVVFCTIELRETETEMLIQSYNTVVVVAGDMKTRCKGLQESDPSFATHYLDPTTLREARVAHLLQSNSKLLGI